MLVKPKLVPSSTTTRVFLCSQVIVISFLTEDTSAHLNRKLTGCEVVETAAEFVRPIGAHSLRFRHTFNDSVQQRSLINTTKRCKHALGMRWSIPPFYRWACAVFTVDAIKCPVTYLFITSPQKMGPKQTKLISGSQVSCFDRSFLARDLAGPFRYALPPHSGSQQLPYQLPFLSMSLPTI